jgi:hypothetical protein
MTKSQVREERDAMTGQRFLTAPGPHVPFAWVVKCEGGCGADMLIPMRTRDPDGTEHVGDPNAKRWCLPCGSRELWGRDIGPGYGPSAE